MMAKRCCSAMHANKIRITTGQGKQEKENPFRNSWDIAGSVPQQLLQTEMLVLHHAV
jgi:hypothetical protein